MHDAQLCAQVRKQQSIGTFHVSEDKEHKYNHSKIKKVTLHDVEAALPAPQTTALLWPKMKRLLLFSGHAKTHLGHFQEFGSILSADEELCMDHLRTRFSASKNCDCKLDGAHTQRGRRHCAGAKWHFNTWRILGAWLSDETAGKATACRGTQERTELRG